MTPRYADIRGALERYPNITIEEQVALRQWYGNAYNEDAAGAPHEPTRELPQHDRRRELRNQFWMRLCFPGVTIAVVAIAVAVLT